jgi:hypothetical protein
MLNPHLISPKHLPSLNAALLGNRSKLDGNRVTILYREAKKLFYESQPSPGLFQDQTIWRSRLTDQSLVVAACTDAETGLYIQLAGEPGCSDDGLLLTFGQKFCVEWRDSARQNVATKIW